MAEVPLKIHAERIDLYITNRCNLACPTCFLGDAYFTGRSEMSLQQIEQIVSWASIHGVKDINFLGGEPTLHPAFSEVAQLPSRYGISSTRLTTNGNKRFQQLFDSVKAFLDFVYLSLDGATEATHDKIRGSGSFENCIKTLRLLKDSEVSFGITHTVTLESLPELDMLIELAEDSGCRVLNVHWLSNRGRALGNSLSIPPDEWIKICHYLESYSPKRSDLVIQIQGAYHRKTAIGSQDELRKLSTCVVRDLKNLQFMPDGRVFVCGLLVDTNDLHAFEWDGQSLQLRQGKTEYSVCTTFTGVGCPVRQALFGADVLPSDLVPICIYERTFSATQVF